MVKVVKLSNEEGKQQVTEYTKECRYKISFHCQSVGQPAGAGMIPQTVIERLA